MKNKLLVFALAFLAVLLALPFLLAPRQEAEKLLGSSDCETLVVITAHNKSIRDEYQKAFFSHFSLLSFSIILSLIFCKFFSIPVR